MRLSTKGRYDLRIMLDMVLHEGEGWLAVSDIARRQNISFPYVEQLVTKLRKAGLVESIRGSHGGYCLAKPASEIKASEILEIVEGPLEIVFCTELKNEEKCERAGECAAQLLWTKINQTIVQILEEVSLEDLVKWEKELKEKNLCKQAGKK